MSAAAAPRYRDPRPLVSRMADRFVTLRNEYNQGWRAHHELLSENLMPFGGRFWVEDRNIGDRRHGAVIDSTPLNAVRTLSAGLMSGASSPARPWFRYAIRDPELSKEPAVQDWLSDAAEVMRGLMNDTNLNHALHTAYEEMAVFGTAVVLLLPDDESIFHAYPLTAGQYYLATDAKGDVNTCYREFQMTVAQTVREFGYENCSDEVQQAFDHEEFEQDVHVVHAIEPNDDRYQEGNALKERRRYRSVYFEYAYSGEMRTPKDALRDGGFDEFPAMVFRWNVSGGDCYGNGPGMEVLGDAVQLQHEQERKGQVIDHQTRPALQIPPSMKHSEVDGEPGGLTPVPNAGREAGIRPLFEVSLQLNGLLEDIADIRARINRTMFTDLFIMLQQIDKTMTAREVIQRDEEKLLMLGPMLTRLFDDGLRPCIDLSFYYAAEAGVLPPPPDVLAEAQLDVEFVSPLAQAQRGIGINSIDRFLQTVGAIAGMKPNALDMVNEDEVIRHYADVLGIDPDLLADEQMVAKLRQARAEQQAALEQAQALQQVTAAQKNAADAAAAAPVDMLQQATGYSNPAANAPV